MIFKLARFLLVLHHKFIQGDGDGDGVGFSPTR